MYISALFGVAACIICVELDTAISDVIVFITFHVFLLLLLDVTMSSTFVCIIIIVILLHYLNNYSDSVTLYYYYPQDMDDLHEGALYLILPLVAL